MANAGRNLIHQLLLKYVFHVFTFVFFALVCYNLDGYFKNIQSTIFITKKYWADLNSGVFWGETAFVVLCYAAAVFVLWKAKVKKYFIFPLLASDILVLFIGTVVFVAFTRSALVNLGSPANIIIALVLVALKDWLIVIVRKKTVVSPDFKSGLK